jgi:threonine/homoserine/homoserine lactone efflux protein
VDPPRARGRRALLRGPLIVGPSPMQDVPTPLPGLRGAVLGAVVATVVFGVGMAVAGTDLVVAVLSALGFGTLWLGWMLLRLRRQAREDAEAARAQSPADAPPPSAP